MLLAALIVSGGPVRAEPAPTIVVADIAPPQGFSLVAPEKYRHTFYGSEGSGDINGDGLADILLLNWRSERRGISPVGTATVVFGTKQGFPDEINLADLDGSDGFYLSGAVGNQRLGRDASFIGDINGDGFDDLAVTDNCRFVRCREYVYVFFGREVFNRRYALRKEKTGPNNYVVLRANPRTFADSGRSVGDVNADGFDDVAFTLLPHYSPKGEIIGNPDVQCVVLYGRARFAAGRNIREPMSGKSFAFIQDGKDCSGAYPASDFDGDGFGDMLALGGDDTFPIVYGRAADMPPSIDATEPPPDVRTLSLTQAGGGERLEPRQAKPVGPFQAGEATSVFVFPLTQPSPETDMTIEGAFVSSRVAGKLNFSLDDVDGKNGVRFVFDGLPEPAIRYIYSVTSAGDFNGDGLADPLLCRWGGNKTSDAKCLLLFGREGAFPPEIRWSEIEQGEGIIFTDPYWAAVETTVKALGDVNGDGLADIYFQVGRYKATVVFGTDAYN